MEQILQEALHLTKKEALIYRKVLQLGLAPVQRISEVTQINRFTLYDILDSLVHRSILGMVLKEKVKQYHVVEPKILLKNLEKKEQRFKELIPQLQKESAILGSRPHVQVHEGIEGIRAVNEVMFTEARKILSYGSYSAVKKLMQWDALSFRKERIKKNIQWKGITDREITTAPFTKERAYKDITEMRISSFVKDIPTWTYIYGNKVVIISFTSVHPIAVVIQDSAIRKGQQQVFNVLWKNAQVHKSAL